MTWESPPVTSRKPTSTWHQGLYLASLRATGRLSSNLGSGLPVEWHGAPQNGLIINPTSRGPIHSTYNWYPCRDVKLKMACQGNGRYFLGLKTLKSDHEWFFWLALRSSIGVIFVGVWILEIPVDKKMMEDFPRSIDAACVYRPTKESCTRSFVLDFYWHVWPTDLLLMEENPKQPPEMYKCQKFQLVQDFFHQQYGPYIPNTGWMMSDTDFNQTLKASLPKNNRKLTPTNVPIWEIHRGKPYIVVIIHRL